MAETPGSTDVAFHPDGRLLGCYADKIFEVDTTSFIFPASPKIMLADSLPCWITGMTIDHTGLLWLVGHDGTHRVIYTYDLNNKKLLVIGYLPWLQGYSDLEWYNGELYAIGINNKVFGAPFEIMLTHINLKDVSLSTDRWLGKHAESWGLASINDECESFGLYATCGTFKTDPRGLYVFTTDLDTITYLDIPTMNAPTGATSRTSWLGSYTPLGIDTVTVRSEGDNCSGPFSLTGHVRRGYYMRPDIQYSLDGITFQSDSVFHDLPLGSYVIHLKDSLGCAARSDSITVGEQKEFSFNQAILYDYCSLGIGEISLKNTDRNNPLSFNINATGFIPDSITLSHLPAGNYTVFIKNSSGCLDTIQLEVTTIPAFSYQLTVLPDTCGRGHGSLTVSPSGQQGALRLSYNQDAPAITNQLGGLWAGDFSLVIADSLGCVFDTQGTISEILGPQLTSVSMTASHCGKSDGSIEIKGNGTGLKYYLDKLNNSTGVFAGISAGSYNLKIEDTNGCSQDTVVSVGNLDGPTANCAIIQTATCGGNNGAVQASLPTGKNWFFSLDKVSYKSQTEFTDLAAGNHTLYVKDENGCMDSTAFTIGQTTLPQISSITIINDSCTAEPATVSFQVQGEAPFIYSLDGEPFFALPLKLKDGNYTLSVADKYDCTTSDSFVIRSYFRASGSLHIINPSCSTPEYLVNTTGLIDGNDPQADGLYHLPAGKYRISYDDAHCPSDTMFSLPVKQCEPYIPNVFTPNHDGVNDVFPPQNNGFDILDLKIFDRWGELVHSGPHLSWDGTLRVKAAPPGVYVYLLKYQFATGEIKSYKGEVTLIR